MSGFNRILYSKALVWFKKQTTRDDSELHEKIYEFCLLLLGVWMSMIYLATCAFRVVHQSTEERIERLTTTCSKLYPVGIYLLKVNNRNTRTRCSLWICLKPSSCVSIVNLEQVNADWDHLHCKIRNINSLKYKETTK